MYFLEPTCWFTTPNETIVKETKINESRNSLSVTPFFGFLLN